MAATNLKQDGLNFQKKGVSLAVATLTAAQVAGDGSIICELPRNSLIVSVRVLEVEDVTVDGTVDILVGASTAYNEVAVDATALASTVPYNVAIASDVTVRVGAGAIAAGTITLLLEYVEYTKNTGEMTNI